MKFNTSNLLSPLSAWLPVFAPEDGTGGGATDTTGDDKGNGDTGDDGGKASGSGGTALDGGAPADDKSTDGADDKGDGADNGDGKTAIDGKADDAGADDKGDGKTEADDVVPEDGKYEFKLPEGVELSDEQTQFWGGKFAEAKLTQGQVDAIVAAQADQRMAEDEAFVAEVGKRETDHLTAAKADAELGGDKWDSTLASVARAIDKMGGSTIKDLLVQGGHGNNPEVIRELHNIGKLFAEDSIDKKSPSDAAASRSKSWYGSTTPETKKG